MADAHTYTAEDWPYGLRCIDCHREFVEGQPISERLFAMTEYADEPAPMVEIVCVECALTASEASAPGTGADQKDGDPR